MKAWSSAGRLLFSSRISAATSKMETLYRDIPCLGRQRREKTGERTLTAMKSFKNHEVRQRKGGSCRGGELTKGQSHNKCHFLNKLRRKIKSGPTKLKPTSAGSVTTASKPTSINSSGFDKRWTQNDSVGTGADSFSPVGFPQPLQFPFLNASLSRPFPTKVMGSWLGVDVGREGKGSNEKEPWLWETRVGNENIC